MCLLEAIFFPKIRPTGNPRCLLSLGQSMGLVGILPVSGKKKPVLCKQFWHGCRYTASMKQKAQASSMEVGMSTGSLAQGPFFLLSASCYLILANMYYAQPIVADMAQDAGLAASASGLIVTMLQVGYMLGILFWGPLGDAVENRKLIVGMTLGAGAFLALAALAPTAPPFLVAHLGLGMFSAVTQVVVVFAVSLAPQAAHGRALGIVTAGLFGGIVLSRPTSSLVSGLLGWRGLYAVSAVVMGSLAWTLWRRLPAVRPCGMSYVATLRSLGTVARLVRHFPLWLLISSLSFGSVTLFWTATPVFLVRNMGCSHAEVALFSLAGLATPPCVVLAGRLLDKGCGFELRLWGTGLATVAWLLACFAPGVALLALAAFLLDPGVNVTTVSVQQAILAARPEARARCNALSVAANFCGGALGAGLGPWLLTRHGWQTVALTGMLLLVIPFLLNLHLHHKERS